MQAGDCVKKDTHPSAVESNVLHRPGKGKARPGSRERHGKIDAAAMDLVDTRETFTTVDACLSF